MFSERTAWNLTRNRYSLAVESHASSGGQRLDLTVSNPTDIGIQYDETKILQALSSRAALEYHPDPAGLLSARESVCRYYGERGDHVDPGQVVLTSSTSEGYSFIFRLLCNPGDELLVPSPSYPLFEFLADLQDVRLVPYPLLYDYGWQIDFGALRQCLSSRTRAIILVHPNNPTGSLVKPQECAELNQICTERDLALVVDEVFLDYVHTPSAEMHQSFVSNKDALTFVLSGLSKIAGLPQIKLAWICVSGPETIASTALSRLEVIADTFLSVSVPIQLAAPALLESRHTFQQQLRSRIQQNLAELDCQLFHQSLCSRLDVEAGWYAILRAPATRSDEDLAIELLEKQDVLVHPGHFYDFRSDGHLVISLIAPPAEFQEGIRRLLAALA